MTYDPKAPFVGRIRCKRCDWAHVPRTGQEATLALRTHARSCPKGAHVVGREEIHNDRLALGAEFWTEVLESGIPDPYEWTVRPHGALEGMSPDDWCDQGHDESAVRSILHGSPSD